MVAWVAVLLPLSAQNTGGALDSDRPVWQESDPDGAWYLANRRALVGRGCSVNKLVTSWELAHGSISSTISPMKI